MKNKDKKFVLNLFALIAVALTIASIFTPLYSSDTFDYYKDMGYEYEDISFRWIVESSILFSRWNIAIGNMTGVKYFIFGIFPYETEEFKEMNIEGLQLASYELISEDVEPRSNMVVIVISLLISILLLASFFYFCYKGIKSCVRKKTRYLLYAGFISFFITFGSFFVFYFSLNLIESKNDWLQFTDYFKFEYGFYYMIVSIILFFIAFVLQNYFIDFSEDKSTVEKVLFEKYKE